MNRTPGQSLVMKILIRWFVNVFGLWIAAQLLSSISYGDQTSVLVWAGLALSLVNVAIKPIIVLLSFPAIVLSLGIFMLFVNGFMIYLVGELVDAFVVATFGGAILAGIIVGLVNYAMTTVAEERLT